MIKPGSIVLVEDDQDDKEIFEDIVRELGITNEIYWFPETTAAYQFLETTTEPVFLIFCDINMPGRNGLEFKRHIDSTPVLRRKSIPFVYFSTVARQEDIDEAYINLTIQGFFTKGTKYDDVKSLLKKIFDYWDCCRHPNSQ
ncbi:response regulator [Flavobacterium selenitireducens]|uniref:response regulator n=1 Tax=Flavobacterium selenitireducens TaxID=2722704 RepID=UPI002FCD7F43